MLHLRQVLRKTNIGATVALKDVQSFMLTLAGPRSHYGCPVGRLLSIVVTRLASNLVRLPGVSYLKIFD